MIQLEDLSNFSTKIPDLSKSYVPSKLNIKTVCDNIPNVRFYKADAIWYCEKQTESIDENLAIFPCVYFSFILDLESEIKTIGRYFDVINCLSPETKKAIATLFPKEKTEINVTDLKTNVNDILNNENLQLEDKSKRLLVDFICDSNYRFKAKNFANTKRDGFRPVDDLFSSIILKIVNMPDSSSNVFGKLAYNFYSKPELFDILISVKNNVSNQTILTDTILKTFVLKTLNYINKSNLIEIILEDIVVNEDKRYASIKYNDFSLTTIFYISENPLEVDDLKQGDKIRFFETPFFYNNLYYYLSTEWVNNDTGRLNFPNFCNYFNSKLKFLRVYFNTSKEMYVLAHNMMSTPTHPFLILAGISGTGKSRFVRTQAEESAKKYGLNEGDNFCLVPVRPDWHEPSDLLGYVSRISGTPEFIPTKFTQFLIQSWLHIFKTGGNLQSLGESTAPYWLCLDEMNLAPVEQYFADYLSILESRKWDDNYTCDALIDFASTPTELVQAGYLKQLTIEDQSIVEDPKWEEMWQAFGNKGIPLPPNLIVAGTVNMDETTHGFSRKVLDRALSLDFNEFYKNDLENFFNPHKQAKTLTFSTITQVKQGDLENTVDENGVETIKFVRAINDILTGTPFELAYRALNQALMLVAMWGQKDSSIDEKIHLAAIWDDFLMMKVLPRIEGDDQKLAPKANFVKAQVPKVKDKIGDKEIEEKTSLLTQLYFLLSTDSMLGPIWGDEPLDPLKPICTRPDLHQEKHIKYSGDVELTIPCRSRAKLLWMIQRMERGYTSFWA